MTLKFKESFFTLLVVTIIMVIGIFVLKMPITITLLTEAVFVGVLAICKGTTYLELQNVVTSSISTILTPLIILLLIGALVASWIMSGTVPTLICIGLKAINPKFFLITSFVMCSATSMVIGTSWGTISTLGVAFMGISGALGLPPIYTVSTIVSGAIIGDKLSPLSSSVVLAEQLTNTNYSDTLKAAARTNVPAFILSAVIYIIIGLFSNNTTHGAMDSLQLLNAISTQFKIGFVALLPPIVLVILIICKFPTIPAFIAGIAAGVTEAIFVQGHNYADVFEGLLSGYTYGQDAKVNALLNYGGINSMASILTLLIFAASFGGIIKYLGIISSVLDKAFGTTGNKAKIITSAAFTHAFCFVITGNYYTTNSILAPAFQTIFKKNGIKDADIAFILLDTGTGISPLVPWCPTAIFVTNTLGFASLSYCIFSPVLWLPLLIYPLIGIFLARKDGKHETR